ncbi:hypothetical protein HJC23_002772 [Cyclotella cryptica]|uniref:Uncharacterized protein n=1 Tax=Cyclotella cryptica TaxID=29204 RepID=A0ABD3PF14_9STRA
MPTNNVQQLGDTGGPQAWFQSLPLVARYWFGSALLSHAPPTSTEPYNTGAGGGTADYIFALMFGMSTIFVTYPLLGKFEYLGCGDEGDSSSVRLPGADRPHGKSLRGSHGIAVGHLFYFLVDVVPIVYGKDVLHTPQFLIDRLGVGAYVPPADVPGARGGAAQGSNVWRPPGRANAPQDPARPAREHDWGSGLGSS